MLGVCVKSCPKLSYPYADLSTLITYSGVYQLSPSLMNTTEKNITQISGERIQVADYSDSHTFPNTSCSVEKCMPFYNPLLGWNSEGINEGAGYAFYAVDTNSYLNRCIVSGDALGFLQEFINLGNDETEFGKSNPNKENKKWINKSFSDIYMARQYILGFGLIFAVVRPFISENLQRTFQFDTIFFLSCFHFYYLRLLDLFMLSYFKFQEFL